MPTAPASRVRRRTGRSRSAASSATSSDIDIVGIFPDYATAYAAWKARAQATVDNAHVRYFIAHLHRLTTRSAAGPTGSWARRQAEEQMHRMHRLTRPSRAAAPRWPARPRPPARSCSGSTSPARGGRPASRAACLERRRAEGKEDAGRLGERMGEASLARPGGPARLVPRRQRRRGRLAPRDAAPAAPRRGRRSDCLVTTGTVTSAQFLADRLPENCLHQYAPVDVLPWVQRFLDHWRPDLAVWTESELWPATLTETRARGIPMLLINARISTRSFRRWRMMRAPRRGAPRPLRPHPRPGRAGRRAADRARRRPGAALGRGHAQGRRRALALRRGRAGADRPRAQRPPGLARRLDPSRRGGDGRSPPTPARAARCRCWR